MDKYQVHRLDEEDNNWYVLGQADTLSEAKTLADEKSAVLGPDVTVVVTLPYPEDAK